MLTTVLALSVFVSACLILFSIAWNQAPDEQDATDEEREIALLQFYRP